MKPLFIILCSLIALSACSALPDSAALDSTAFEPAGVLRIDLQEFAVPAITECNNPAAHNWYEQVIRSTNAGDDKIFALTHAVWLGLCTKISRADVTQLEAITAFDNLLHSFDAAQFLVEPFGSRIGKRKS